MSSLFPSAAVPRRRLPRAALAVVVGLAVLLAALRVDEAPVGAVTDDAFYVEMARSVAAGRGPVLDVGPDAPAANPDIFPPGMPLLLAPLAALFPASLQALKAVPLLATLLLLPLCWRLPGPDADDRRRLLLVALVALNPWVLGWSGRILSDNPYTALSLAALLVYDRWSAAPRPAVGRTALLALLAGLAVLVRSIGAALVLALAAHLVLQRRWRHLAAFLPAVAASQAVLLIPGWSGGGWLTDAYRVQMVGHDGSALQRLAFMGANAWGYLHETATALVPVFGNPLRQAAEAAGMAALYEAGQVAVGAGILVAAGVGLRRMAMVGAAAVDAPARRRAGVWTLYLVLYAGALLNFAGWPSGVQTRLLLPVAPLLYAAALAGLAGPARRPATAPASDATGLRRAAPWAMGAFCVLALSGALAHDAWRIARPLRTSVEASGRGWFDPGVGADWILAHAAPEDVVMTVQPLVRHIHFRRPAVDLDGAAAPDALLARARRHGVRWVLIGPSDHDRPRTLTPGVSAALDALRSMPGRAALRWSDPAEAVWIFELTPAPAASG